MGAECTYCGQDVSRHDPVFVAERDGETRRETGQFCNYACLRAHIDEAALADGAACAWPGAE